MRVHFGPADWVTFVRAVLVVVVAGLLVTGRPTVAVPVAVVALVLDLVAGQVARRTGTASAFGARFDGEVDAALILVLSIQVAADVGAWVLAIGLARYAFGAAGLVWPWLRAGAAPRYWRKVVAAIQGIVLTTVIAGVLPA